jgi:hypothetical protein
METRVFSYHWAIKALKSFFIAAGLVVLVDVIWLIHSTFMIANAAGNPSNAFVPAIIVLFVALVFSIMCISGFDRFPEIVTDTNGVTIRYLFRKIHVPLEDIVRLETHSTPWFSKRKNKFVVAKNFPLYYRVSNVFLHGTLKHGFIINSSIIDYEALSASIQNRISPN